MSGTEKDRSEGTSWIAERLEGGKVKFVRPATEDDVEGQGFRFNGLGQTEEDVEGQKFKFSFSDTGEDIEGQGFRFNGLGQTEEDVEGQKFKFSLSDTGEEEVEGEMLLVRLFAPEGTDLTERFGRMQAIPADPDGDVGGQGLRIGG